MAGVVASSLKVNEKVEWENIITDKNEAAEIKAQKGAFIQFNQSIKDSFVTNLLENSKFFIEKFGNTEELSLSFESYSKITDAAIIQLAKALPQLRKISLKTCTSISDIGVEELSKFCPLLETIDLSWCDISEKSLFFLSKNTKNLKSIGVRSCYITDRSVVELLKNCKKIETLCLAWCKSLTDVALNAMVTFGDHIKNLDLRGNENFSEKGLTNIFLTKKNLRNVHLKRCLGVTKNVIFALAQSKKYLEKINLRGCYKQNNISNNDLVFLFHSCAHLTSIDLAWHDYLEDNSIIALANHCKKLQSIDLSGCHLISSEALEKLSTECVYLKTIVLFKNKNISEKTIIFLKNKGIKVKYY